MINTLQYGKLSEIEEFLICLDRELTDEEVKAILINLVRKVISLQRDLND